jgi:hypothetical protein
MKIRLVFAPVTWKKVSVIGTNTHAVLGAASIRRAFGYDALVRDDEVRVESAATATGRETYAEYKSFNINTIDRLPV